MCFHVCLLSGLLILANFIVKPEIRAVLAVCYDAFAAHSGIVVQ
jgi:hypothetical protein